MEQSIASRLREAVTANGSLEEIDAHIGSLSRTVARYEGVLREALDHIRELEEQLAHRVETIIDPPEA